MNVLMWNDPPGKEPIVTKRVEEEGVFDALLEGWNVANVVEGTSVALRALAKKIAVQELALESLAERQNDGR